MTRSRRAGSEQRGSCTLPVTGLAIVRPRLVSGQRGIQSLSAPWYLAIPSAPACSARVIGLWVHPIPRGGLASPFPGPALGVCPRTLSVSPNLVPLSRGGLQSKGHTPQRCVWCCASQDFPRHAAHPAFAIGLAGPRLLVRPRRHPGRFVPSIPHRVAHKELQTLLLTSTHRLQPRPKLDNPPRPQLPCFQMSPLARLEKRLKERSEERRTQRLTVRLEPSTYEALEQLASEHQKSVSELAREALEMLADEYRQRRSKTSTNERPKKPPKEPPQEPLQQTILFRPPE